MGDTNRGTRKERKRCSMAEKHGETGMESKRVERKGNSEIRQEV